MKTLAGLALGDVPELDSIQNQLLEHGCKLELTRIGSFQELEQHLAPGAWDLIAIQDPLDEDQRTSIRKASGPVFFESGNASNKATKKLLAALNAKKEAPSPGADKSRARKTTHDLSNALALINGFADLLAESKLPAGGTAERYLSIIRRRSNEAIALLEELRDILNNRTPSKKDAAQDAESKESDANNKANNGKSGDAPETKSAPLDILVVDDEPRLREVLAAHLKVAGHQAHTAGDGNEALTLFSKRSFDLVLTDQDMPGLSGEELALKLKELNPRIPIILLTGYGDQGNGSAADVTLSKPVSPGKLMSTIHQLHGAKSAP